MFIPPLFLGLVCLFAGLMLTIGLPIQRGRFRNQLWDFITLALIAGGFWWLNVWDVVSNLVVGLLVGLAAVLVRDFRLWITRFKSQVYRRSHRYYWYGRARDWYGTRRRRRRRSY
jgi:hypothetical protein